MNKIPKEVRVVDSLIGVGFDIQYGNSEGRFGNWTVIATLENKIDAMRMAENLAGALGSNLLFGVQS